MEGAAISSVTLYPTPQLRCGGRKIPFLKFLQTGWRRKEKTVNAEHIVIHYLAVTNNFIAAFSKFSNRRPEIPLFVWGHRHRRREA